MHLNEGEIRAYQDKEMNAESIKRVQTHLETCSGCRVKAEAMLRRVQDIGRQLSVLDEGVSGLTGLKSAKRRLATCLTTNSKEKQTMWQKLNSKISRPVWASLAIVATLVIAMSFPQVRAVADSFLGLFRVEQVKVVDVNQNELPERLGASSQFESMLSKDVQIQERGSLQEVNNVSEASELAGFPVRIPSELENKLALLQLQPGGTVTFQVDLELVQAVLKDIERTDISLPDNLDGATVVLEISDSVVARFGECKPEMLQSSDPDEPTTYSTKNCTILAQLPSPTISAPPELDIAQIGEAYLQLLGLTREEAASFARNVNWTTTFIIPIPRYGAQYADVQVDGVTGTLIHRQAVGEYILVWIKDGLIYTLSGAGSSGEALAIANSMR